MNKNWDFPLQIVFVLGMLLIGAVFYMTRLLPSRADDNSGKQIDPYAVYSSVYQFEQEQVRLETQIKVLKADYASNLMVYIGQRGSVQSAQELPELEKREKLAVLDQIYGKDFFQRKLDLIEEQKVKLEDLLQKKCLKYCSYQDLPGGV